MTTPAVGNAASGKESPIVSIVIPAYNQAEFLDQAITSVLAQDYPNVELIVLDDGSRDSTRELLQNYSGRFFWETHPNMGQANTLNKGWSMAKGEYLSYLAADDFLLPGAVGASVSTLVSNPEVVLTYCDYTLVDARSRTLRRKITPEFSYLDLVVRMICQPGPGPFFRRDAFARAGLWDPSLRQIPDYEYWLRLGLQGKFQRIPNVLAAYRVHDRSQSYGPVDECKAEESTNVITRYFQNDSVPPDIRRAQAQAMSNAHIVSSRLHLRSGRYGPAFIHLQHAIKNDSTVYWRGRSWWLLAGGLFNRIGYRVLGAFKSLFRST